MSAVGHLPPYLFLLAVARHCRHISASRLRSLLLPPPPAGLRWLRGELSLVRSWGQTHGRCVAPGRGCGSSPRPGRLSLSRRGTRSAVGAAAERPELPSSAAPGPGTAARAIASRSGALLVIAAAREGEPAPAAVPAVPARSSSLASAGLGSLCRGGEEPESAAAAPWETKAMFTSDSAGLAGTSGRGAA